MSKTFNDPVHGHIELSSLACRVIDTPQFQRLRDISQLGGVYFVFPGAASKRFEHSLGVAHLAKSFLLQLKKAQPELNISDQDVLCVELAGLCHDIGHGPFSHLFDGRFLPQVLGDHDFAHEHASIAIFELLIKENNLMQYFEAEGLGQQDIHFVQELILGDAEEAPPGFEWIGRGEDKAFLYDIVANKRNGIDVDKMDYFARDCHVLGVTKSFDESRLMRFARVYPVTREAAPSLSHSNSQTNCQAQAQAHAPSPSFSVASPSSIPSFDTWSQTAKLSTASASGRVTKTSIRHSVSGRSLVTVAQQVQQQLQQQPLTRTRLEICYHQKESWNIFELFHTRYSLHKRAYQHKIATSVELMIAEAFVLADPHFTVPGEKGAARRMSECTKDMHAYWRLSEYVLRSIQHSFSPELAPARAAIERLFRRDLFACAGEVLLSAEQSKVLAKGGAEGVKEQLWALREEWIARPGAEESSGALKEVGKNDIFCAVVKVGYGKGGLNPVSELTSFYLPVKTPDGETSRGCVDIGVVPQESVSRLIPREYEETFIRVFTRSRAHKAVVANLFQSWCRQVEEAHDVSLAPSSPLKTPAAGGGSFGSLSQASVGDKRKR